MQPPEEIKKLKVAKLWCEGDLLFFTRYFYKAQTGQKFIIADLHKQIREALMLVYEGKIKNLIINIPPRYGKAIACDTPMLTRRGWLKAGEVSEGDYLIGSDGNWTTVQGVFPQGELDAYKVIFGDGTSLRCCEEHLWTVKQRYGERCRTRRTKDLLFDTTEADGRKKWRIPVIKPIVASNNAVLPIDPYLLGCWLGDGDSCGSGLTTADEEIAEAFAGYDLSLRTHQNAGKATQYGLRNNFITRLKELGLVRNKHIPEIYLLADASSRLALLQGLCDTDGTCGKNGQQSFNNTNDRLIVGARFLIQSLGGIATSYRRNGATTLFFRLPEGMNAFRLERKSCRVAPYSKRTEPRRFIDSILPDGRAEMVCFSVAADDKLFAAGSDLILTHNTEIAVIKFIAWCIAQNPQAKFIHLSYSDDLALDNSSKIKELIESWEFQQFWPVRLKQDSKSKKKWYTEQGGGLYATAAGGPLTGFGAGSTVDDGRFYGAIIIDDPHKVDDADRDGERQKVTHRLNSTIKSRRNSRNTPIIIIMQRLHEEDMTGFAMANGMGEDFHQLTLKALKDDGTALWEFKHTVEELKVMQATDPYGFSGQYQQEPSPEDGEYFKREWIQWYDEAPKHLRMYGASDYAVTAAGGDYTVHMVAGVDPDDDLYLIDVWRERTDSLEWVEAFIDLVKQHKPLEWAEEAGQIRRSLDPLIIKRQIETQAYCYRKQFASTTDKSTRAQAIRGRMAQRKVYFPRGKPWIEPLLRELLQFPNGKFDDQVDTMSLLGRMLAEMVRADKPKPPPDDMLRQQTVKELFDGHFKKMKRLREE